MRALLLVGLCGCEAVFGVGFEGPEPTVDAGDEPDAADALVSACPPPGRGLAPTFSPAITPLDLASCRYYAQSADGLRSSALCNGLLVTGPVEAPMSVPGVMLPQGHRLIEARIAPEGDELYVISTDQSGQMPVVALSVYVRTTPSNPYTFVETIPVGDTQRADLAHLTAPTARIGDSVRVLIHAERTTPEMRTYLEEWQHSTASDGTWQRLRMESFDEVGVSVGWAHLSADGLRMVFTGAPIGMPAEVRVYYRDRSDLSRPFGDPVPITPVGEWTTPYLTEDCERLYFTRTQTVSRIER